MSFRVWKGEGAATPRPSAPSAARATLPMEVVDAGANRLGVLALLTVSVVVLLAIANRQIFSRFGAASMNPTLWIGAMVVSLLILSRSRGPPGGACWPRRPCSTSV